MLQTSMLNAKDALTGLFAPLLAGGALLVDGTAASCYALPTPIADSAGFRRLLELIGWRNMQKLAQMCFSPVRLAQGLPGALRSLFSSIYPANR